MLKYPVAVAFALFSSAGLADTRCDNQASKDKADVCYQQLATERKEALEEYHEAIMNSSNIPANVKATIDQEYSDFMKNIFSFCPDNSCVEAAMMEQIKDMYHQTGKYSTPQ